MLSYLTTFFKWAGYPAARLRQTIEALPCVPRKITLDGWLQVTGDGGHDDCGHRVGPWPPQEAAQAQSHLSSTLPVLELLMDDWIADAKLAAAA